MLLQDEDCQYLGCISYLDRLKLQCDSLQNYKITFLIVRFLFFLFHSQLGWKKWLLSQTQAQLFFSDFLILLTVHPLKYLIQRKGCCVYRAKGITGRCYQQFFPYLPTQSQKATRLARCDLHFVTPRWLSLNNLPMP